MNRQWTDERIEALKRLAMLSTKYRPNGNPYPRLDWETGLSKLDLETKKILGEVTLKQCKSAWGRFQNVAYGYCMKYEKCGNKIKKGQFLCPACKIQHRSMKARGYSGYIYTANVLNENKDIVKQSVQGISDADLRKIVVENISRVRTDLRKKLLGERYKKLIIAKAKAKEEK